MNRSLWWAQKIMLTTCVRKAIVAGTVIAGLLICIYGIWYFVDERLSWAERVKNPLMITSPLRGYWGEHDRLPPAFIPDRDGRPAHSWRVLILPYAENRPLFDRYDFGEPWDGPKNIRLIEEMPREYGCLSIAHKWGKTNYVAVVGPGTVWSNSASLSGYTTGPVPNKVAKALETIWVLELNGSDIDWTEPRDLTVEEAIAYIQGRESSRWKRPSQVWGITGFENRLNIPATASTKVLEALFSTDESKIIPYDRRGKVDFQGSDVGAERQ